MKKKLPLTIIGLLLGALASYVFLALPNNISIDKLILGNEIRIGNLDFSNKFERKIDKMTGIHKIRIQAGIITLAGGLLGLGTAVVLGGRKRR